MTRPLTNALGLTAVVSIATLSVLLLSGSTGAVSKGSGLSDATLELVPVEVSLRSAWRDALAG